MTAVICVLAAVVGAFIGGYCFGYNTCRHTNPGHGPAE